MEYFFDVEITYLFILLQEFLGDVGKFLVYLFIDVYILFDERCEQLKLVQLGKIELYFYLIGFYIYLKVIVSFFQVDIL